MHSTASHLILPPLLPFLSSPSDKTTIKDMQDMASSNIKALGGFLQAEPVGPYERADRGMETLPELVGDGMRREGGREGGLTGRRAKRRQREKDYYHCVLDAHTKFFFPSFPSPHASPNQPRRGSIPVTLGVPEVVMGESLFSSDVRDHTESSYFEAIQVRTSIVLPCVFSALVLLAVEHLTD